MGEKFLIKGGFPLEGKVKISGYKNSAGAILAAVLLSKKPSVIDNLSICSDVINQIEILKRMGGRADWLGKRKVRIDAKNINPKNIPFDLFEKMRVSVLLIAPLLTRFKSFKVPHPGGDKIGLRPIITHLRGLKNFGVRVREGNGFYHLERGKRLRGGKIVLKEFSVTATENAMMLAAGAEGKTTINIAASEPQVQDLGNFLEKMGAGIKGIGSHTIEIEGKKSLSGVGFKISPDPLEAGTFLIAFALTGGRGIIENVKPGHLTMFLEKMKDIGVNFSVSDNRISVSPSRRFRATKIQVLPYPGFPTDLQPQTTVLLSQAEGKSLIHDPLYENRFQHLQELRKMGADIEITDPHRALIFGKRELIGNKINASDIRSGAALVLAALAAKGRSEINGVEQIDRGYERLDGKLRKLGARIKRV